MSLPHATGRLQPPPGDVVAAAVAALAASGDRVVRFSVTGRTFWAKRVGPAKANRWHGLQRAVSRLIPLAILRPTVSPGGPAALAFEAQRIAALALLGVAVPEVVRTGPGWMVLSDVGPTARTLIDGTEDAAIRERILLQVLRGLADLHARGGWHGRGLLSDLVPVADGIALIDLEEGPPEAMARAEWQARDLWLCLGSVARYAWASDALLDRLFAAYAADAPAPALAELRRLARSLRPLRWLLAPFAGRLGRDLRQAIRAAGALERGLLAAAGEAGLKTPARPDAPR